MRIIQLFALGVLAVTATAGVATADDRINLTPPLFREQARSTAAVRPASELTTTVRPVPAPQHAVEATGSIR